MRRFLERPPEAASCGAAALVLMLIVFSSTPGMGSENDQQPSPQCSADAASSGRTQVESLLEAGGACDGCVETLKPLVDCFPDDLPLVLLLSRAYEARENGVWARRVVTRYLDAHPESCGAQARLAWLHLANADYRSAEATLDEPGCTGLVADKVRWHLLRAEAHRQAQREEDSAREVQEAMVAGAVYGQDAPLLAKLKRGLWPLRGQSTEFGAELWAGWSSNPLLGSPLDPQAGSEDHSSPRGDASLRFRQAGPWWGPVRLFAEIGIQGRFFSAADVRELSHMGLSGAPGVEISLKKVNISASFKADTIWLGDSALDDPFYSGQRGELLIQTLPGIYLMAGGGKRLFQNMGRSRIEGDAGFGWGGRLTSDLFFLGGISGRMHDATNEAYNLRGATAITALRWRFFEGYSIRLGLSGAYDSYPDSAGSEAFHATEAREDYTVRGRIGVWSPPLPGGFSVGVQYEPSRRISSAKLYDFADHSLMLQLSFSHSSEAWGPTIVPDEEGISLGYGIESTGGALEERLQDLLRSDEESQRGSSCLD